MQTIILLLAFLLVAFFAACSTGSYLRKTAQKFTPDPEEDFKTIQENLKNMSERGKTYTPKVRREVDSF